eukprot:TRINITY_DN1195_c0_g1_i1.p2 TRINITY_DN1195_c0_g1~~TRINITY_DN1195_c0_g1_i1.p2  ORF type:complete len:227 (+),score=106.79 TRINITY_DN1195_c0_g1_i1:55-681(+)
MSVYLYVPNLIGYARVALTIYSYFIFFDDPMTFLICYWVGFLLDAADGQAARMLNQCSKFGGILDMITDRAATAGLVLLLSHLYVAEYGKTVAVWAALFSGLDLVSHFARIYCTGGMTASHKGTDTTRNPLLKVYYNNRIVLGGFCLGQEAFYLFLYTYHFYPEMGMIPIYVSFPIFCLKQLCNAIQLMESMQTVAISDTADIAAKKK